MKKLLIFAFFICFVVCSCDKEYKYVPFDKNANPTMGDFSIKASSDSVAYNHALSLYAFDIKSALREVGVSDYPHGFLLTDSKYKIVPIDSEQKERWTNSALQVYFGDDGYKIDTKKSEELLQYFDVQTDKNGTIWYLPKSRSYYNRDKLSVWLYFNKSNNKLGHLHIYFGYTTYSSSYNWLYINKLVFSVNGEQITYIPDKVEKDKEKNSSSMTQEIDEVVSNPTRKFINSLLTLTTTQVKLVDRSNEYLYKSISEDDVINIRRSVELYKAMGGFYLVKDEW